jgi:hypothetical protein
MKESFNQLQKKCKHHLAREVTRVCYCELTDSTCNSYNCPLLMNKQQETEHKEIKRFGVVIGYAEVKKES